MNDNSQGDAIERIIQRATVNNDALTPTDDEREVLIADARRAAGALEEYEFEGIAGDAAGLLNRLADLAVGFRRTVVPEPQETFADRLSARSDYELGRLAGRDELRAEQDERKKSGVWVEHAGHCNAEPQGEPSDALRDAIDHIQGAVEFQDAINPEAVRVVIDAALRAASTATKSLSPIPLADDPMRAPFRNVRAVTEQGENLWDGGRHVDMEV